MFARDYLFKFLATSSGGVDLNVSASSANAVYSVAPDTSRTGAYIERVNISVITDGTMTAYGFGQSSSQLAAGIKVEVLDESSAQVYDFLDGQTITHNGEWAYLAGADVTTVAGTSVGAYFHQPIRWTLGRAGKPLHLPQGHRLAMTIQDDVSSSGAPALLEFRAMAQGTHY